MSWRAFCEHVVENGAPLVFYAYFGTEEQKWGESLGEYYLGALEVALISKSNGSNFPLIGEEYEFKEQSDNILTYESPKKSLAFAKGPKYVIVTWGPAGSCSHCFKAAYWGLDYLESIDVSSMIQ
ncbi:uncharacterized protein LOC143451844 [Clavelina lepadiformis]|uniref:uncharacterized protein LOC143451844 n=1 Tax=Clavelina lepadiformis TaxID=159417 RepID=UPI0040436511